MLQRKHSAPVQQSCMSQSECSMCTAARTELQSTVVTHPDTGPLAGDAVRTYINSSSQLRTFANSQSGKSMKVSSLL